MATAALLAAGCAQEASYPYPGSPAASLYEFEAGGTPAAVFLPESDVEGLVIYNHGAGEHLDDFVEPQGEETLVGRLVELGWAVAASEAHGNNWGSEAGVEATAALWQAIDREIDVDRVVMLAHSMGGVTSLNCIAVDCVPDVDGWIGIYPLVDQRTMESSWIASTVVPEIEATFGGPPPADLIPVENVDAFADVPMLMWASPGDNVVSMERNAAELARRVEAAGGDVDLRVAHGEHGDPSHFDTQAVLDFVTSIEDQG